MGTYPDRIMTPPPLASGSLPIDFASSSWAAGIEAFAMAIKVASTIRLRIALDKTPALSLAQDDERVSDCDILNLRASALALALAIAIGLFTCLMLRSTKTRFCLDYLSFGKIISGFSS